jgi:eukaryotic-like serine/threonine-protein kinase
MTSPKFESDDLDDQLDDLVAEVLLARESGEPGAAARVAAENPDHAEALERHLARLDGARGVLGALGSGVREKPLPERIGGHIILRELGRGGMGVVYLARDEKLDRDVALKAMTNPALAGERGRERFQREVRAVAALSHPNIVSIHEAGEDEGTPYYTMPYVEGRSLAGILAELRDLDLEPTCLTGRHLRVASRDGDSAIAVDPKRRSTRDGSHPSERLARTHVELVARLVLDVAEALAHAHAGGILHRDVKPSNIMVSGEGRALLCDFGLARGEESGDLTRSGDFVGTPHYVAPEQAAGGTIDARCDVYALGATLYELLTLRVPHDGRNTAEILRKIGTREPTPLRKLNPAAPRDLETICATAMAKEPAARYASAEELAEDLRCFITYRPVQARPVGPVTRALRWTRRNPMTAVALASLTLLVVVGPTTFGLYSQAAARRLEQEQAATVVQRDRADRNVERVLRTVDEMLTRMGQEDLVHVPRMDELRRELLERALQLHQELIAEGDADEKVQRNTARAQCSVAQVLHDLGRLEEADAEAERAVELLTALHEAPDAEPQDAIGLTHGLWQLSLTRKHRGDLEGAEEALLRALALGEERLAVLPDSVKARQNVADTCVNLGGLYTSMGRHEDGERALRDAVRHCEIALEDAPGDFDLRSTRAAILVNLSIALFGGAHSEEAESVGREAVAAWQRLVEASPTWSEARLGLLKAVVNLADLLEVNGTPEEMLELTAEALRLGGELSAEHPDLPEYAETLTAAHEITMKALASAGRLEEAAAAGEKALARLAAVAQRFSDVPRLQGRRAEMCAELADIYGVLRSPERELTALRGCVAARRAALAASAESTASLSNLGGALNNLAGRTAELGDPEEALQLLGEAVECQRAAIAARPEVQQYQVFLRNHLWGTAEISLDVGDLERCVAAARELPLVGLSGGVEARAAAGFLAQVVGAGGDAALADEAVALLTLALERGTTNREDLLNAPDLTSLRSAPAFADLVDRAAGE